jgi:SAM-dependent methyltransferase
VNAAAGKVVDVQAFYQRYPYPPPVDDLERYRQRWAQCERRRAEFHLFWPTRTYREDFSILIAGCGTSQAAKYAIRWPAARVTGVDFSTASLEHTERLRRKYRLENLALHLLPLEQLDRLGARFDQIVCTGVLHHLDDPDAGLRSLRAVLEPHGAMQLMVYAPYGRYGIYMLQEFCRRVGFRAPDADVRELIAALKALPAHHPLSSPLREAPDFQSETAVADALLHPQDRAYSVPQFLELLHRNGLSLGRWLRQAPYDLNAGVMSKLPISLRPKEMAPEQSYAAAELFRGDMTRHSAIVYRNDNPEKPIIRFEDDLWLDYVPIRIPDTLTVREQLPAGIAAILINRAHSQRDICLPVRPQEIRLLEEIDGTRKIRDMVRGETDLDFARSLFERLWSHDQVVFDATPQTSATPHGRP